MESVRFLVWGTGTNPVPPLPFYAELGTSYKQQGGIYKRVQSKARKWQCLPAEVKLVDFSEPPVLPALAREASEVPRTRRSWLAFGLRPSSCQRLLETSRGPSSPRGSCVDEIGKRSRPMSSSRGPGPRRVNRCPFRPSP